MPARLLPAGARALTAVPPTLPGRTRGAASPRPATLLRRVRRARRSCRLRTVARAATRAWGGGGCEAPVRGTRGGTRVSLALYPSRRHLQPAAHRAGRTGRDLPLEGLPREGAHPLQGHDPASG